MLSVQHNGRRTEQQFTQEMLAEQSRTRNSSLSCSRSMEEIALDILRGKITQFYSLSTDSEFTNSFGYHNNETCFCKLLIYIQCSAPQYWLLKIKQPSVATSTKTHYLNCIESFTFYRSFDSLCFDEEPIASFTGKNWYLFETMLKIHMRQNREVLIEEFVDCKNCSGQNCVQKIKNIY